MAAELPVPIDFELPDGWVPAPAAEIAASGAAFLAVLPAAEAGFTTNITIDGQTLAEDASLVEHAEEAVARLRTVLGSVSVTDRSDAGTAEIPGLAQVLTLSTGVEGVGLELTQSQVYLSMPDQQEPGRRAMIRLTLTAPSDQHDAVADDFHRFVSTVRPDDQAGGAE